MKTMFGEYGRVVIAVLVIVALIAIISILRPNPITLSFTSSVEKLSNYVTDRFNNIQPYGW